MHRGLGVEVVDGDNVGRRVDDARRRKGLRVGDVRAEAAPVLEELFRSRWRLRGRRSFRGHQLRDWETVSWDGWTKGGPWGVQDLQASRGLVGAEGPGWGAGTAVSVISSLVMASSGSDSVSDMMRT